jgi:tetratricopeptide (TPR) repeat protein
MRLTTNKLLLACLWLAFGSCETVRKFTIEVQEPASITLPVSAQNVLILNNAITQPAGFGIERELGGIPLTQESGISFDSLTWTTVNTLADVLAESEFFRKVSVFNDTIRSDDEWLTIVPLSKKLRDVFFETEGYDVLLTIDRQIFQIDESAKKNRTGFENLFSVDIKGDVATVCSIYLNEREKPLRIFSINDSLFYKNAFVEDSSFVFKKIPEYLLDGLAQTSGKHIAFYFLPMWIQVDRYIFTNSSARMSEANSYAKAQKWLEAESIWKTEYDKKTKPIDQARIALNMAVANEMQDQLHEAIAWAEKALQQLKTTGSSHHSDEKSWAKSYIEELNKRIQKNRLLDLQLGTGN